jgi:hypothetical protein
MQSSSQSDTLNSGYGTRGRSRLNGSGQLVTQLDYRQYGLSR